MKSEVRESICDFVSRFKWQKEGPISGLKILSGPGEVRGDCKSFALTVTWLYCQKSVLRMLLAFALGRVCTWSGYAEGSPHVMTEFREGWICNIQPRFSPKPAGKIFYPVQAAVLVVVASIWFILS